MRHKLHLAAAGVAALALATGGAAVAGSRVQHDSDAERRAEAEYTATHRSEAAVSQAAAEAAATAARPGTIVDTHLEHEGSVLVWEVKTDDGRTVWEVQVDAQTGRVVSNQPDD